MHDISLTNTWWTRYWRDPIIGGHIREYKRLRKWAGACGYEPGHFYSPIPFVPEVKANAKRIFADSEPLDVDLKIDKQFSLLQTLKAFNAELPYDFLNARENTRLRYRWVNGCQDGSSDVVFLYSIISHLRPTRI